MPASPARRRYWPTVGGDAPMARAISRRERERAGNDLDALDVRDEGNPPVHLAGTGVLNGLAVEQDEGFVLIDAAQGHAARPGSALRRAECAILQIETGDLIERIAQARNILGPDFLGIDDGHGSRRIRPQ